MKKIKHSKLKNTGILFELLVRQITSDTLNNVNESHAGNLIRKYFHKNSPLSNELGLYQTLVNEKFGKDEKANSLVEACITARGRISNKTLAREKYNLIKSIKENWNIDEFFSSRVNNYKVLASIYKIFEYNVEDNPKMLVESKFTVLDHITTNTPNKTKVKNHITEELGNQDKDIRNLTYKFLIEKFNSKYGGLSVRQKKLLEKYINNDENANVLKEYINTEAIAISRELKKYNKQIKDSVTNIKVNESIQLLEGLNSGKAVKDGDVLAILRYYDLVKELKLAIGDK